MLGRIKLVTDGLGNERNSRAQRGGKSNNNRCQRKAKIPFAMSTCDPARRQKSTSKDALKLPAKSSSAKIRSGQTFAAKPDGNFDLAICRNLQLFFARQLKGDTPIVSLSQLTHRSGGWNELTGCQLPSLYLTHDLPKGH